jgi:hypothetical protein
MTREEAVAIYDSGQWKDWTAQEKVSCQLYEERLIMPFGEFQNAVNEAFGRPVFTHEFANPEKLQAEYEGKIGPVSLQESLADVARLILKARANEHPN